MNRPLLIAGHGYLGRELARQARAAGWQVTALSKSGDEASLPCDLTCREAVTGLRSRVPDPASLVFTASSGRGGPDAYRAVFLDGVRHLHENFPAAHLIFVSSTSVYHQCDGSLVTEESPTEPDRETSRILLEAEAQVLAAKGTVARLAGLYGPGRSVILKRLLEGAAVIEEDGRRFLNQIHRDDAAAALLHLASHPGWSRREIFNLADSTPLSQRDCYHALAPLFDRPVPPNGPRAGNRKRAWTHKAVSNQKLRRSGWAPVYPSFLAAAPILAPSL